jgi:chromosome segregation ATPase
MEGSLLEMSEIEIQKQIAALGATIEGIGKRVIEGDQRRQEAERRASEGRTRLYEKVNEVAQGFHGLQIISARMETQMAAQASEFKAFVKDMETRVANLEEKERTARSDIDEMRPKVDQFAKWEQRGIGIGIALTVLGTMFGALLVTLRDKVVRLFVA